MKLMKKINKEIFNKQKIYFNKKMHINIKCLELRINLTYYEQFFLFNNYGSWNNSTKI